MMEKKAKMLFSWLFDERIQPNSLAAIQALLKDIFPDRSSFRAILPFIREMRIVSKMALFPEQSFQRRDLLHQYVKHLRLSLRITNKQDSILRRLMASI